MSGPTWWRWLSAATGTRERDADEEAEQARAPRDMAPPLAASVLASESPKTANQQQMGNAARQIQRSLGNQGVQRLVGPASTTVAAESGDLLPLAARYEHCSPQVRHEILQNAVDSFLESSPMMQSQMLEQLAVAQKRFGELLLVQHLSLRLMPQFAARPPIEPPENEDDDDNG